jgi:protein ImuB
VGDRNSLVEGAMKYAVVHPPNFFAQAAARERPELRKKPFVLLDGEPPGEVVFAANNAARSLGAEVGMNRLQVQSVPEIVILPRIMGQEVAAHMALHAIACRFSPRIETVASRPGTYALDIQGMNTLFGDSMQLATKLRQHIMTEGFLANVAVSDNFDAAICLAYGKSGVSVVSPGDEANALGHLPLSVLNLEPEHTTTFETWGIRTCADLAALAETNLIARLGQVGKKLHALARGDWPHLMFPIEASFETGLIERMNLECPIEDLERLLFLLSRMITTLLERVCSKARAIASLRVVFNLDGDRRHERIIRPALPLQDKHTLLKLLQLDLEMHPPTAAILAV